MVVKPTSQTRRGLATPVMIELASAFHPTRTVGKDCLGAPALAEPFAPERLAA